MIISTTSDRLDLNLDGSVRQEQSDPANGHDSPVVFSLGRLRAKVLLLPCAALPLLLPVGCKPAAHQIKFPQRVLIEDFQTPFDRDLSELLLEIDRTRTGQFLGQHLIRPLFDDVNDAQFTVGAIELRPGQFPNRPELTRIVDECARVLQMPKPRVYVTDSPSLKACAVNFADPTIILPGRILKDFTDSAELRFIIGREMGHIRCGHTKWQPILHWTVSSLGNAGRLPQQLGSLPLLPILKWSREAEMSADDAGLICCQDRQAAERVLAAFLLGTKDDAIGEVNVESLLAQRPNSTRNEYAELVLLWRQAVRENPFVPERILQLRQYESSTAYKRLWH